MARYKAIPQGYMMVGGVARKMGITVRALQYYDREGLFSPSCVSDGGRRLYSDRDVVKLHQILALKSLGFSFDEIKNRLTNIDTPDKAISALTEQANAIQENINMLTRSLQAIEALKAEIQQMQTVDFTKYADIIVNLQMGNKYYGLIKHFDENMLDHCHKNFDKDTGAAFINRFNAVLSQAEKYTRNGVAPDSATGQSVAKEFWQLITEFTGGDMSMLPELMNMNNAQLDQNIQSALNGFIEPALEAYFKNSGIDPFGVKNG